MASSTPWATNVCLLHAVPAVPGSSLQVQPGDQGVVTDVGEHFLTVHLDGLRIIASKGDVVRMARPDRAREEGDEPPGREPSAKDPDR